MPNARYSVALHQKACGANPGDAGDAYRANPAALATSKNTLTVPLNIDAAGNGSVGSTKPWNLRSSDAKSLVLTASGQDGKSKPVACVTLS